jgi:hypothetical protein
MNDTHPQLGVDKKEFPKQRQKNGRISPQIA